MGTFQRNAIISGYINSYCLVCESFFETEDQTFSHIKGEDHENKLLAYRYLEKYGNNGIRKVKAGYFCEYCSQLMTTGAKVNLHIAEKLHYYNKGNMLLKQSGSSFTAFDDVLITENAWHSLQEDECLMCNMEFDDQTEHITERSHILKLLQNPVQFGINYSVYRKIDKNDFQCLTCNIKLPLSEIEDHFSCDDHKKRYIQCQEDKKKHDLTNPTPKAKLKEKMKISKDVKRAVGLNNNVCNKETIAGIEETITETNKKAPNRNTAQEKPAEAKLKEKKDNITKEAQTPKFITENSSDPLIYTNDDQESTTKTHKKATNTNNAQEKPAEAKSKKKDNVKKEPKTPKLITENSSDPLISTKDDQESSTETQKKATDTNNAQEKSAEAKSKKKDNINRNRTGIEETRTETNKKAPNTNNAQEKAEAKWKEKKDNIKKEPKTPKFIKEDSSDLFMYAINNQFIYHEKTQKTYCEICVKRISTSLCAMKEHVKGRVHINKLANVIKEYRCQICLINFSIKDLVDHFATVKHNKGMMQISFITNYVVKDDCVREVRSGLEYCCHVWDGSAKYQLAALDSIERRAFRLIDEQYIVETMVQSLEHRGKIQPETFHCGSGNKLERHQSAHKDNRIQKPRCNSRPATESVSYL